MFKHSGKIYWGEGELIHLLGYKKRVDYSSNCPKIPGNPPYIFLVLKNKQAVTQPTSRFFWGLSWALQLTNLFPRPSRVLCPHAIQSFSQARFCLFTSLSWLLLHMSQSSAVSSGFYCACAQPRIAPPHSSPNNPITSHLQPEIFPALFED